MPEFGYGMLGFWVVFFFFFFERVLFCLACLFSVWIEAFGLYVFLLVVFFTVLVVCVAFSVL